MTTPVFITPRNFVKSENERLLILHRLNVS